MPTDDTLGPRAPARIDRAQALAGLYPTTLTVSLRISDLDPQGHVNNVAVADLFQEGRARLNAEARLGAWKDRFRFMVAGQTIEYGGEIHYPGEVTITTGLRAIGRSSLVYSQIMRQNGHPVAFCEATHVMADATGPVPVPQDLVDRMASFRVREQAPRPAYAPPEPHPHYVKLLGMMHAAGRKPIPEMGPVAARQMMRDAALAMPPIAADNLRITDDTVQGAAGRLPARVYEPAGSSATVVYLPSGGWVVGDIDTADATCRALAMRGSVRIVSVTYRKAPENPFPAALDDTLSAITECAARFDGPVFVMGESAGGNLAAAAALVMRDTGVVTLAGQVLAYPVLDHVTNTASYLDIGPRNYLLTDNDMRWFWDQYAPAGTDRSDPRLSPQRAVDLSGLPPTLLTVGELDVLHSEALAYADRLARAGVPVTLRRDPAMLHGYLGQFAAIPAAAAAHDAIADWLARHASLSSNRCEAT